MEVEIDNARAALSWSLVDPETAYDGLALAALLVPLWSEGHLEEGCDWLDRILARGTGAEKPARAGALYSIAQLTIYRSGFSAALPYIEQCVDLSRSLGRREILVQGLSLLAIALRGYGQSALTAAEEAVALARELADPTLLLRALYTLGSVAFWQGDLTLAHAASEEAINWGRGTILHLMTAAPLRELGNIAYRRGDYAAARRYFDESVSLLRKLEHEATLAQSLASLARVALAEGNIQEATEHFNEVFAIARDTGSMHYMPLALSGMAGLAAAEGKLELAVRRLGAAEALGERIHWPMGALYEDEHAELVASLRETLGDGAFRETWTKGKALTAEQVLHGALLEAAHA
jgi:tetratricopeptide (TPR) repeat protein